MGIVGVIGFLATGLYMHLVHDHLQGMTDARRLLFRSCHIYLLMGSLVNLAIGLYLMPVFSWRKWVRLIGSLLVLASPVLAAIGFFAEPWLNELDRPFTMPAIYGCLAGMVMHVLCVQKTKMPRNLEDRMA